MPKPKSLKPGIPATPFVKWAGGKSQLLKQFAALLPEKRGRGYFEPFVGSGAVFFNVRSQGGFARYTLSETNADLITCFEVVRDDVETLIVQLREHQHKHSETWYYHVRGWDLDEGWAQTPVTQRAARMIYLNKTCYNGLYRVNREGHFNVPMGRYRNPAILDESGLRAASAALQGAQLSVGDFEDVVRQTRRGDFIYLDPPYVPLSKTSSFTGYSPNGFGEYEHRKLALVFAELDRMGCQVMLSNSDTPLVRELYAGFRIDEVIARRAINTKGDRRGAISELVVRNY